VIDYALARRSTLESLRRGATTAAEVCDADPYLLRAAKFHGEPTDTPCPICRRTLLTTLNYTFGDVLGQYSGRLKATAELETMAREHEEFTVYVVEVCCGCSWNHLRLSYVLGDGVPRDRRGQPRERRRSRAAEE
jgi:Family of unknown function (DUF5318)